MLPGGINPTQMKKMMKQMGMKMDQIEDVRQIVITTAKGNYIFDQAEVSVMTMQGVTTWQIAGEARFEEAQVTIPDEDVALVVDQTGASEEDARAALTESKGDIAEAILKLTGQ